jgi:hypothetical protein
MHGHRVPPMHLPAMLGFGTEHITDEMRQGALADAERTTAQIDQIRKKLELPVEQLPLVVDAYIGALNTRIAKEQARVDAEERAKYEQQLAQYGQYGGVGPGFPNLVGALGTAPMICSCGGIRKPQG